MKAYQKPELTVLRLLSKEAVSDTLSDPLADWLTEKGLEETPITTYSASSLGV